ncbi:MAG: class I SAM-dependent methyltransferase [Patescibacteria group bacterium]
MDLNHLSVKDFSEIFGVSSEKISEDIKELINKSNFSYYRLDFAGIKEVILKILKRIDSPDLGIAGAQGKERWVRGWQENLDNFIKSGYDINELVPKFIRPNQPIRLFGDYVVPLNSEFELNFYKIFRSWIFSEYLFGFDTIYEFGCGTGFNLVELAKLYPEKKLHGLEWVSPSVEILRLLREKCGYNITGHLFDMFSPDKNLEVTPTSAFLAIGALEQIGKNFEPFLEFVLEKRPAIFVHVDSITELYGENNLSDYLALKHDIKRNYLQGYLTRLRELEKEGRVEIMKVQKVSCGGLYHDGYSYIIWKPK